MASEVTLPALGESVTEGTVTRWLKQVGDTVAVDEPLLEVSTDKVDTEIPSPVAGTLLEIKANEDDTVEVGAVLGVIGEEGESAGDASETAEPEAQPQDEGESEKKAEQEEQVAEETGELPDGDETPESEKDDAPAESEPAAEQASSGGSSSGGGGGGGGTPVTLPALGESVTEGTVTRWLKQVGDEVAVDEPLLEVSTDKVDTEIPSPVAGTLLEIKAEEDETVEVGAELAIIGSGDAGSGGSSEPQSAEAQPKDEDNAEKKAEQEQQIAEEKGELPAGDETPSPRSRTPPPPSRSRRTSRRWSPRPRARPPTPPPRRASPSRSAPMPQPRPRPPPVDRPARPVPRRAAATSRRTSPRWCARWPTSTASTSGRCRAPESVAASASRTSSTPRLPPSRLRPPRPRLPPPRPPLPVLRPPLPPRRRRRRRRCVAPPSRSRACAR